MQNWMKVSISMDGKSFVDILGECSEPHTAVSEPIRVRTRPSAHILGRVNCKQARMWARQAGHQERDDRNNGNCNSCEHKRA